MRLWRKARAKEPVVAQVHIPAQNGLPAYTCDYASVEDAEHDAGKLNEWLQGVWVTKVTQEAQ